MKTVRSNQFGKGRVKPNPNKIINIGNLGSSAPYECNPINSDLIKSIYTGIGGDDGQSSEYIFSPLFIGQAVKANAWIKLTGHYSDQTIANNSGIEITNFGDKYFAETYVNFAYVDFEFSENCSWHYVYMAFLYYPNDPVGDFFTLNYEDPITGNEYELLDASFWEYWWTPGDGTAGNLRELALMQYVDNDVLSSIGECGLNYLDSRWQWEQANGQPYAN